MADFRKDAAPVGALLLLCLVWALPSLWSDLMPGSTSAAGPASITAQAVPLALFAILAAIVAWARKSGWPTGKTLGENILVGFGLFVAPAVLIQIVEGHLAESTRVALFSLAPVFAVIFEPYLGSAASIPRRNGLAASLVAVAGTLLVFPLDLPQSVAAAFSFCAVVAAAASVAAANCVAVRRVCEQDARSERNSQSLTSFAATVAGSAAILLALLGSFSQHHGWSAAQPNAWTALDLLALALLFWLMRRMTAVRMTARFLLAPLLANLIGLALLRPGVQFRGWLGLLLIALGSGWLLLAPREAPDETGSPLGIN